MQNSVLLWHNLSKPKHKLKALHQAPLDPIVHTDCTGVFGEVPNKLKAGNQAATASKSALVWWSEIIKMHIGLMIYINRISRF